MVIEGMINVTPACSGCLIVSLCILPLARHFGSASGALRNSLSNPVGFFGVALQHLWVIRGYPRDTLGGTIGRLGSRLGDLGNSKGTLGSSLCQYIAFIRIDGKCGSIASKQTFWNTRNILKGLAGPLPQSAAQTLPVTRAYTLQRCSSNTC